MKILLIDADSTIPNLALMKLSGFYKSVGHSVDMVSANLPYYPNKKKKEFFVDNSDYDLSFCSVVFNGNSDFIKGKNIEFGGTGFDMMKKLPPGVEAHEPDYSIYPENDTSYGFISRGCNRTCSFCDVWRKEGKTNQVSEIDKIIKHKKVKFLDNNFLQLRNHKELLNELAHRKIRCQFNQGLDIRLIDDENSKLLSELNYLGEYIFAFDDIKYQSVIKKKLELLSWRKPFQFKFFVYIHPDMKISETVSRVELLKEWECLPYLMRDISCWGSENEKFFVDLASWCNQPGIFKNMDFYEFLNRRHLGKNRLKRINASLDLYISGL
jgi:hypothetical protein